MPYVLCLDKGIRPINPYQRAPKNITTMLDPTIDPYFEWCEAIYEHVSEPFFEGLEKTGFIDSPEENELFHLLYKKGITPDNAAKILVIYVENL